MEQLSQEFNLNSNPFIRLEKAIIKLVGLQCAVLYCELLSKKQYFKEKGQLTEDGYFYNTRENLKNDTGLSKHQQSQCIDKLEEIGLINCVVKGVPAKRYFYVSEIEDYSQLSKKSTTRSLIIEQQEVEKLDNKKFKNQSQIRINNKTNNKNKKQEQMHKAYNGVSDQNLKPVDDYVKPETRVILKSYYREHDDAVKSGIYGQREEENSRITLLGIEHYYESYYSTKGKKHPNIKKEQLINVFNTLNCFISTYDILESEFQEMIDRFFISKIKTDHNINHFATEGILDYRYRETSGEPPHELYSMRGMVS